MKLVPVSTGSALGAPPLPQMRPPPSPRHLAYVRGCLDSPSSRCRAPSPSSAPPPQVGTTLQQPTLMLSSRESSRVPFCPEGHQLLKILPLPFPLPLDLVSVPGRPPYEPLPLRASLSSSSSSSPVPRSSWRRRRGRESRTAAGVKCCVVARHLVCPGTRHLLQLLTRLS